MGGSYSGALSSWFKFTYPDSVVGAWSSSGVVNAIFDFYEFDLQVFTAPAPKFSLLMMIFPMPKQYS